MTFHKLPLAMGAVMGLGMMWMLHASHVSGSTMGQTALIAFVAAHVAVVGIVLAAGVFAARMSPKVRNWMARIHRPSLGHLGLMIAGMAAGALVLHLSQHGVAV